MPTDRMLVPMIPPGVRTAMTPVRRLALDVLKPHEPELLEFGRRIGDLDGVAGVNVAVIEIDREVQNVNLTIEGDDLDYGAIQDAIREQGATVHSVAESAVRRNGSRHRTWAVRRSGA